MKKSFLRIGVIIAGLLLAANTFAALAVNLAFLANANQSMPGIPTDQFANFSPPHLSGGYTVFAARGALGNAGIFTDYFGFLRNVASTLTTVPSGAGNFSSFTDLMDFTQSSMDYGQSIQGNTIVFIGFDHYWRAGLYKVVNGGLVLIANQQTLIPGGQGTFTGFNYPTALANGGVLFWGSGNANQEGFYAADPQGRLSKLIDTTAFVPSEISNFTHFLYPSVSHDAKHPNDFAFVGVDLNQHQGLYLLQNGRIKKIADGDTSLPGTTGVGYFTQFKELSYDSSDGYIAFVGGGILGQTGLYIYNGSSIRVAATPQSLLPNTVGQFSHFYLPNLQGNNLIFSADGSLQTKGVYLYTLDGNLLKVVSSQDSVNNKTIISTQISHEAFSGNQVAVLINFIDGTSGIYLATLKGIAY